jgi:fatty-acyl-CoA synthase
MTQLLTISDAVATHARLRPSKVGARDSQRALTYAQWDERASRLGAALLARGLRKGERVALLATNCLEWMELYVALARASLVAVPINFRLTGSEIAYIVDHAEAKAIIAGAEFCAVVDSIRDQIPTCTGCFVVIGAAPSTAWTAYEDLMASASAAAPFEAVHPDDLCALMYTSGTTGRPKGAMRSHSGSSLIALATALEMGFTPDDTGLLVMPLCHANSLYFGTTFIHLGATCIVDDRRSFDPEALLAVLARDRVTFTSLVPTHYIMLLSLPPEVKHQYDVSSVGKLLISSAPARKDTKLAILEHFRNGKLYELYGSTEHGWVTLLRPHEQIDRLGSVGREWAGSGPIRILGEDGNEVPDGEVGELYARTPYVFDGYWKDPDKTAEAFRGAWSSVGDMARRDSSGYIWLVDRKSNMIISGGENVYPSEVESVLGALPKVKDVAVIGLPHPKWGEAVHAVLVLHAGASLDTEEVRLWCKQRLAGFKCPTSMSFIPDADMPRTATGKIQHRLLKARLAAAA